MLAPSHASAPRPSTADTPAGPLRLACSQIHGGNERIHVPFELPGLRGVLHSRPSDGGRGGDVYYLSLCGSGLLSRICVADVVGHGATVARVSAEMHRLLRRFADWPDQRRIFRALNRVLRRRGLDAMTTAAACTYYPPRRTLSFSYAGHPPGWIFRAARRRWERLALARPEADGPRAFVNGALAVTDRPAFTRARRRVEPGDRLLFVTDGVLEAPDAAGDRFGAGQLEAVLHRHRDLPIEDLASRLLDALRSFAGALTHDDVTFLLAEVVPGPGGSGLGHVIRNRLLRPLGLAREASPARSPGATGPDRAISRSG